MLRSSLTLTLLLTVLTGLVYPLLFTGAAQVLLPAQANGSLMVENGRVQGTSLIGQWYEDHKYFWPRLSATGPGPYNAAASSGSNHGPLSPDLHKAMEARRQALRDADPENRAPIPIDLLTASGSGLDPHISPAAAAYQAARVARARGVGVDVVQVRIAAATNGRQFGFLGEPTVNVVLLNRALDRIIK